MRKTTMLVMAAAVLAAAGGGTAGGQTHAPWPADWDDWNDPALWCVVGDAGNAPDTRYGSPGAGRIESTYKLGRFEVTAGQYCTFLNAVAKTDTYGLYSTMMTDTTSYYGSGCNIQRNGSSGHYTYSVAADWANRPVNCVSWGDAVRFANWLQNGQPTAPQGPGTTEDGAYAVNGATTDAALAGLKRKANAEYVIPDESEWYKGAYHQAGSTDPVYYDYATGTNTMPRSRAGNPTDPGNSATWYSSGYSPGSPYFRTEVGEHENSPSPYGTFDQCGNVSEWTETYVGFYRSRLGGSFQGGTPGSILASRRELDMPTVQNTFTGFRVAHVPEPGSAILLLSGAAALRRKRRN